MDKIKIGDVVARKSYNYDILFVVKRIISKDIIILKGITIRIEADAKLDDLAKVDIRKINENLSSLDNIINKRINNNSSENINKIKSKKKYKSILNTGTILHLDGDKRYAEKSNRYYKKIGLEAVVKNISENMQPIVVKELVKKIKPDILIITGHDGMIKRGKNYTDILNYRNSRYFIETVREARKFENSEYNLAIFAGACQSFYEAIMSAGANFASSPGRILIDFMDPLIVAEKIAITDNRKFVTINDIVNELRDGKNGIDGIGSLGKKRL